MYFPYFEQKIGRYVVRSGGSTCRDVICDYFVFNVKIGAKNTKCKFSVSFALGKLFLFFTILRTS